MKNTGLHIFISLLWCFFMLPASAQEKAPLTQSQVRRFLKTEIKVDRLQMRMKAHSSQYDSLIRTFFKKKNALLIDQGWDPDKYHEIRKRVLNAEASIHAFEQFEEERAQDKKAIGQNHSKNDENGLKQSLKSMIANIKAMDQISEQKKKEMIEQIKKVKKKTKGYGKKMRQFNKKNDAKRYERLTENKADWPAVRPYLKVLKQLGEWYGGNAKNPPEID